MKKPHYAGSTAKGTYSSPQTCYHKRDVPCNCVLEYASKETVLAANVWDAVSWHQPCAKSKLCTALTAKFVTGRGAASPALPEKTSRVKDSNSNIIGNGYLQVRILPLVV